MSVRVVNRVLMGEALDGVDLSTTVKVDADVEFTFRLPSYQTYLACVYVEPGSEEAEGEYECTYSEGGVITRGSSGHGPGRSLPNSPCASMRITRWTLRGMTSLPTISGRCPASRRARPGNCSDWSRSR